MDKVEDILAKQTASSSPTVSSLIASLSSSLVYSDPGNVETNRRLWNAYSEDWNPDKPWVQTMAKHVSMESSLTFVGDEWSTSEDLLEVLDDYVFPYLKADHSVVAEIGSGGGRVSSKVVGTARLLHCFDISSGMLGHCREKLSGHSNVDFHLLSSSVFEEKYHGCFDMIIAFDVYVHVDLHTQFAAFQQIRKLLKRDGLAFISTANVLSPLGWERFSKQSKFTVGGFYFTTPDAVLRLLHEAGLRVVRRSDEEIKSKPSKNTYYLRDLLLIVERDDSLERK